MKELLVRWRSTQLHVTCDGHGPGLLLLAGTGQDTRDWHRAGYVTAFAGAFTTVCVDLPGQGLTCGVAEPAAYSHTSMLGLLDTVADRFALTTYAVIGYSAGGALALQAAAFNPRISAAFAMAAGLGAAIDPDVADRGATQAMAVHRAKLDGTLDALPLTADQRHTARQLDIPVHVAWLRAMAAWPPVTAGMLRCPTLLYLGCAEANIAPPAATDPPSRLQVSLHPRLDHAALFEAAAPAIAAARSFLTTETSNV